MRPGGECGGSREFAQTICLASKVNLTNEIFWRVGLCRAERRADADAAATTAAAAAAAHLLVGFYLQFTPIFAVKA